MSYNNLLALYFVNQLLLQILCTRWLAFPTLHRSSTTCFCHFPSSVSFHFPITCSYFQNLYACLSLLQKSCTTLNLGSTFRKLIFHIISACLTLSFLVALFENLFLISYQLVSPTSYVYHLALSGKLIHKNAIYLCTTCFLEALSKWINV